MQLLLKMMDMKEILGQGGMKMNAWEMPQVQALGEERLRLMQEAAEKCRGEKRHGASGYFSGIWRKII